MKDAPNASILIVEDNETTAIISAFNLESAGFSVEIALDGQEALEKTKAALFDVIVTDELMPRLNGQEFVRRLRQDKRYANTPVFFVTGKRFEFDEEDLKSELGVEAVILKPFSPRGLVELVHGVIA